MFITKSARLRLWCLCLFLVVVLFALDTITGASNNDQHNRRYKGTPSHGGTGYDTMPPYTGRERSTPENRHPTSCLFCCLGWCPLHADDLTEEGHVGCDHSMHTSASPLHINSRANPLRVDWSSSPEESEVSIVILDEESSHEGTIVSASVGAHNASMPAGMNNIQDVKEVAETKDDSFMINPASLPHDPLQLIHPDDIDRAPSFDQAAFIESQRGSVVVRGPVGEHVRAIQNVPGYKDASSYAPPTVLKEQPSILTSRHEESITVLPAISEEQTISNTPYEDGTSRNFGSHLETLTIPTVVVQENDNMAPNTSPLMTADHLANANSVIPRMYSQSASRNSRAEYADASKRSAGISINSGPPPVTDQSQRRSITNVPPAYRPRGISNQPQPNARNTFRGSVGSTGSRAPSVVSEQPEDFL